MRPLVLLLSLLTVNNVAGSLELRPKVLQPDLDALSKYFKNIDDTLLAYIHWPKEITYRVRLITKNVFQKYLKIDGTFTNSKLGCDVATFDGIYYKNDKFYVKMKSDGPMKEISEDDLLYYSEQPKIIRGTSFLSIRYFDLREIRSTAKTMYEKKKTYYDCALLTNPAIFLITPPGSNHFLESYILSREKWRLISTVEGGLRVLFGEKIIAQGTVNETITNCKIIIDSKTLAISMTDDMNDSSRFERGTIFGVRMGSVGFLAEHRGPNIRMLSNDDVSGKNGDPNRHSISGVNFPVILRKVEPSFSGVSHCLTSMPKFGKFQVSGHILVKYLNTASDQDKLDPECPFVIKFEDTVSYFLFGSRKDPVKEACTNDVRVWPKGEAYPSKQNIRVTLVHPFARN